MTYYWDVDPLDAPDGKDNDKDGLIDEGVVRKLEVRNSVGTADEQKERNSIVLHNVTKNGLTFQYDLGSAENSNDVTLFLELQAADPNSKYSIDDPDPKKRPIVTRRSVTGVSRLT